MALKDSDSPTKTRSLDPGLRDDLVRCFWMALGGRTEDLSRYLQRAIPRWNEHEPELAKSVEALLRKPGGTSVERRVASRAPQPPTASAVEAGRQAAELVRVEDPVALPIEPVWPEGVSHDLQGIIAERRATKRLSRAGLSPTKTAIFTGPPGVGKTLAARWVARELGLPLASLNLGTVMSSFLGRTGSNLRDVMSYASSHPCVLFLDEIDAVAKRRDDDSDIGELKRLVTVLLQEIDAWPADGLLLAATNHEQLLDPAVWRRFERRVVFPPAGSAQQSQLLERMLGDDWTKLESRIRESVAIAGAALSPSDLSLLATRALRDVVLNIGSLEDRLPYHLQNALSHLPLADRRRTGMALKAAGHGQREINRLTGLARETIRAFSRKAQRTNTP